MNDIDLISYLLGIHMYWNYYQAPNSTDILVVEIFQWHNLFI